jgi:hypothetical protein
MKNKLFQGHPLQKSLFYFLRHALACAFVFHSHSSSFCLHNLLSHFVDVLTIFFLYQHVNVDSTPSSRIDVDEFCPRMDEANMMILNQIGDYADDTGIYTSSRADNESDSDNELLPKNAVIPEPDEIDAVEDESEDLLADSATVLTQSAEYKRKHFSNTSSDSSDSDDSITRGLDFKNIPVTATIEPHSSPTGTPFNLLTNIQSTLARNLIDTVMKPTLSSQTKAFDSEDEISDFEILDKDELMK